MNWRMKRIHGSPASRGPAEPWVSPRVLGTAETGNGAGGGLMASVITGYIQVSMLDIGFLVYRYRYDIHSYRCIYDIHS